MSDAMKIYELYVENAAANEQPQMKVDKYGDKEWSLHGKLHRIDGPAVEWVNGDKFWYHHGALHREDGPAAEYADGTKEWYLHGALHREDGAAVEYDDGTKMWFLHNILHREDGAAVEYADGTKAWYLHGKEYKNAAAWAKALLKHRNEPHDADAAQKFVRAILTKDDLI